MKHRIVLLGDSCVRFLGICPGGYQTDQLFFGWHSFIGALLAESKLKPFMLSPDLEKADSRGMPWTRVLAIALSVQLHVQGLGCL